MADSGCSNMQTEFEADSSPITFAGIVGLDESYATNNDVGKA